MSSRNVLRAVGGILIAVAAFMMLNSVWLRAHLGGADSQLKLAYAYGTGKGVEIDQEKAIEWYRRAAEQGDARGQMVLATRYDEGEGLPANAATATMWYERAANTGNGVAQFEMAKRVYAGKGTPQNNVRAAMWLILADRFAAAHPEGVELLEVLRAALTEEKLAEARSLASDWRAANPGAVRPGEGNAAAQALVEVP